MEPYGGALTRGERSVVPHTVVQCCSADTTHRFYLLHIHLYILTYIRTHNRDSSSSRDLSE